MKIRTTNHNFLLEGGVNQRYLREFICRLLYMFSNDSVYLKHENFQLHHYYGTQTYNGLDTYVLIPIKSKNSNKEHLGNDGVHGALKTHGVLSEPYAQRLHDIGAIDVLESIKQQKIIKF